MISQLDNHHMSLQDKSIISTVSHAYSEFVRHHHQFQSNLFNMLSTIVFFNFVYQMFKFVLYRNQISMRLRLFSNGILAFCNQHTLVFPMDLHCCHIEYHLSYNFNILTTKQIVSSYAHCIYSCIVSSYQHFSKCVRSSYKFNQCVNVHGHTHAPFCIDFRLP
jgi:hypothetical protein